MIQSRFRKSDVTARTSRATIHAINSTKAIHSRTCFTLARYRSGAVSWVLPISQA